MVASPVLTIEIVGSPPVDPVQMASAADHARSTAVSEQVTIEAARSAVGQVWTPAWLPDEFRMISCEVLFGIHVHLTFSDGEHAFLVRHSPAARFRVPPGAAQATVFGDKEGYLVRGVWTSVNGEALKWMSDAQVQAAMELGGKAVTVSTASLPPLATDVIVKIASSLAPA